VRVTDENDPFFVYSLGIGEDDFQGSVTVTMFVSMLHVLCMLVD